VSYSHIPEQAKDLEILANVEGSGTDDDWVQIGFLPDADKLVATFMKKRCMFVLFLIWIEKLLMEEYCSSIFSIEKMETEKVISIDLFP
jgi:hypothetical protein